MILGEPIVDSISASQEYVDSLTVFADGPFTVTYSCGPSLHDNQVNGQTVTVWYDVETPEQNAAALRRMADELDPHYVPRWKKPEGERADHE